MTELTLDETVDISRAGMLYDKLAPLLEQSSSIQLNLSNVTRIDGAGVQLTYAFTEAARRRGLEISCVQPSEAFKAAVNTVGLADYFNSLD